MKRTTFFLSAVLTLIAAIGTAKSQTDESRPTIRVTGRATINLAPDELSMTVSIVREDGDPKKAVADYRATRESVLRILRQYKTGDTNVTEHGLRFSKQTDRNYQTGQIRRVYYRAEVLRDSTNYPDLVLALTGMEGVSLSSVGYRSSKEIETKRKARLQAVEAARTKAKEMAAVYGAKLGKVLLISENQPAMPFGSTPPVIANRLDEAGGALDSQLVVSNELIQITAAVYVEFELVQE